MPTTKFQGKKYINIFFYCIARLRRLLFGRLNCLVVLRVQNGSIPVCPEFEQ